MAVLRGHGPVDLGRRCLLAVDLLIPVVVVERCRRHLHGCGDLLPWGRWRGAADSEDGAVAFERERVRVTAHDDAVQLGLVCMPDDQDSRPDQLDDRAHGELARLGELDPQEVAAARGDHDDACLRVTLHDDASRAGGCRCSAGKRRRNESADCNSDQDSRKALMGWFLSVKGGGIGKTGCYGEIDAESRAPDLCISPTYVI